jgi:hypothetical protein
MREMDIVAGKEYDFIIVGAGAAGSVLAAELSASGAQVLVIESGGPDDGPTIANPSVWFYNVGGPLDYHLPITPLPQLNNRKFYMALGHVLGGGSTINAMVWARGMQRDYDGWARNGAKGWSFADVLPVFKYVHPDPSPDAVAHSLGIPDNLLDFPTDTNRAVAQMHYKNRFTRTPNVKYIFSHAGGSIPYLSARFTIIDEMGFVPGAAERGTAAEMFPRIYWDTALAASDPVFHMLRDVAGINQVLYGTDFPYLRRDLAISSKQKIVQSSELNDSERRAILGSNAQRLFPRRFKASRNVIEEQHEYE